MILVSGATGFIGRYLVKKLVSNYSKDSLLCLGYPDYEPIIEGPGRQALRKLNVGVQDVDLRKPIPKNSTSFELVFHLASNTDTAEPDHSINEKSAKHLLDSITVDSNTHIVFASSIAVSDNPTQRVSVIDENTPLGEPLHRYGVSKINTEHWLIEQARKQDFRLSVVRVCAVYGVGQRQKGLFGTVDRWARNKSFLRAIPFPGRIGIMNVEDMAEFFLKVGLLPPAPGQYKIYNPVTESLSVSELLEELQTHFSVKKFPTPKALPLWRILNKFLRSAGPLAPILPHSIYNRIWQAILVTGDSYNIKSGSAHQVLGARQLTTYRQWLTNLNHSSLAGMEL